MAAKTFTLPQLAAELGRSPKSLRAALRKAGLKRDGTRWVWPLSEKATIRAICLGKKLPDKKTPSRRKAPSESHVALH